MTTRQERAAEDQYEQQNDTVTGDAPAGDVQDNSYIAASGPKATHIPVAKDDAPLENPGSVGDPNSDGQLAQDENEAINKDNIIGSRTRGAKPAGSYSEGPDENQLPAGVVSGDQGGSDMTRSAK